MLFDPNIVIGQTLKRSLGEVDPNEAICYYQGTCDDLTPLVITQTTMSTISALASMGIIIMILRSKIKLSSTFNRLLVALSTLDILSSVSLAFATLPIPSEYNIWGGKGTIGSCTAQGFFILTGALAAPLYNSSICISSLLMVKYRISEEMIKHRVEPFFHFVAGALPIVWGFTGIGLDVFNPSASYCFVNGWPFGCILEGTCERGGKAIAYSLPPFLNLIMAPFIVMISMGMLYCFVSRQEKRNTKYGESTLGSSNNIRTSSSQSTIIFNRTMGLALSYVLTWTLPTVNAIMGLAGNPPSAAQRQAAMFFYPSQGIFNFLVFIYPKTVVQKRTNPDGSWFRSFLAALVSNGEPPKKQNKQKSTEKPSWMIDTEAPANDIGDDTSRTVWDETGNGSSVTMLPTNVEGEEKSEEKGEIIPD